MFSSPWIRTPKFPAFDMDSYDDYWRHRGWEINKSLKVREEIILDLIPARSRVLDIGCGNSLLPVALKEKGASVDVADLSPLVLEGYKEKGINGVVLDLEKINDKLLVEKYDYIILSEVLEHIKNPEQVLNKLSPFTKNFMITVPNSAAYMFRYGLMFKGRFFTQWVYHPAEHIRFWSHIDFLDWLAAQNLEVEKVVVTDGFSFRGLIPSLPRLWKNLLGFRMLYQCRPK